MKKLIMLTLFLFPFFALAQQTTVDINHPVPRGVNLVAVVDDSVKVKLSDVQEKKLLDMAEKIRNAQKIVDDLRERQNDIIGVLCDCDLSTLKGMDYKPGLLIFVKPKPK